MSAINIIWGIILISFSTAVQGQIFVDGKFEDWDDIPVTTDIIGDSGSSAIDFGEIQITNDDQNVYFRITVGKEINLQSYNSISIAIDTDADSSTGVLFDGIGADLRFYFGDRYGDANLSNGNFEIYHTDIDLVCAKTVSDEVFEFSINRSSKIEGKQLFSGNTIKVILKDEANNGDKLPDVSGGISYTYTDNILETKPYYVEKSASSDLRVMSFNVLQDGLFDSGKFSNYKRIFRATKPDIIGFQEIYDHSSGLVADKIEDMMPNEAGEQWYNSDVGPDIHCISRYPILQAMKLVGSSNSQGNGAFLIDLPYLEEHLLLIVAHLPCCDNNYGRQQEVDAIMSFIRNSKNGSGTFALEENTPIIIVGDMNFVGDSQNLQSFYDGNIIDEDTYGPDFTPDWDGSNLLDAFPYTTDTPAAFTWYSEYSSYGPGRIDVMMYTGSQIILDNSYALFTQTMNQDTLLAYELYPNDVGSASDHLPIIGDFSFINAVPVATNEYTVESQLEVYPNPADEIIFISIPDFITSDFEVKILDNLGKTVQILNLSENQAGRNVQINTNSLPSRPYFIQLSDGQNTSTGKFMVVR